MYINPFKPTAGKTPPQLVGREQILLDFTEGLENGSSAPELLMRITGPRGSGKTVILNELGKIARDRGWLVIDETAFPNLGSRILEQLQKPQHKFGNFASTKFEPRISAAGLDLSLGEITIEPTMLPTTLCQAISMRLNAMKPNQGIMITIDEIQDAQDDEITAIAIAIQHLIREDNNVAFVFAGLPQFTSELLNAKLLTFLRRATVENLGDVPLQEVGQSYQEVLSQNNAETSQELVDKMADASEGYPYLIQLVGYGVWRAATRRTEKETQARQSTEQTTDKHNKKQPPLIITETDVEAGIVEARARVGQAVCAPAINGLSDVSLEYIQAMAIDNGPSKVSDIAQRLNKDKSYIASYRSRLIEEKVIRSAGYGLVDFALPYMREYLRSIM